MSAIGAFVAISFTAVMFWLGTAATTQAAEVSYFVLGTFGAFVTAFLIVCRFASRDRGPAFAASLPDDPSADHAEFADALRMPGSTALDAQGSTTGWVKRGRHHAGGPSLSAALRERWDAARTPSAAPFVPLATGAQADEVTHAVRTAPALAPLPPPPPAAAGHHDPEPVPDWQDTQDPALDEAGTLYPNWATGAFARVDAEIVRQFEGASS